MEDSTVCHRTLSVERLPSGKSEDLESAVVVFLKRNKLNMEDMVSFACDGASNMIGVKSGLTTRMMALKPNLITTWCVSHRLNLVVLEVCKQNEWVARLFSMLQQIFVFFRESAIRKIVIEDVVGDSKKQLARAITHKWHGRAQAIERMYGHFSSSADQAREALLPDVIMALLKIQEYRDEDGKFRYDQKCRTEASTLCGHLTSLEMFYTAIMMGRLLSRVDVVMRVLQTGQLGLSNALDYMHQLQLAIQNDADEEEAERIVKYAREFVQEIENRVRDRGVESDEAIFGWGGEAVTTRRRRAEHELPETRFKAMYLEVYANINKELARRFNKDSNTALSVIRSCTHNGFLARKEYEIMDEQVLTDFCTKFTPEISVGALKNQLVILRGVNPKVIACERGKRNTVEILTDEDVSESVEVTDCRCIQCMLSYLVDLKKWVGGTFDESFKFLKFLLTLSCTSDHCERGFSSMKFVKTARRSALDDNFLDKLMLMYLNVDVLRKTDNIAVAHSAFPNYC